MVTGTSFSVLIAPKILLYVVIMIYSFPVAARVTRCPVSRSSRPNAEARGLGQMLKIALLSINQNLITTAVVVITMVGVLLRYI